MNAMNNFTISGFVVNDAKVKNFEKASVARFGLSFRTTEKKGDVSIAAKIPNALINIYFFVTNMKLAAK